MGFSSPSGRNPLGDRHQGATRQGRPLQIRFPRAPAEPVRGLLPLLVRSCNLHQQLRSRCTAPAASAAGRSPGAPTPFHGDGSGRTYEGSMVVSPLKRNDSYNLMRPPCLVRSTEGFAAAKLDVPPSRAHGGRGEHDETALRESRLNPSRHASACLKVSGQDCVPVSALTPQQPEMPPTRLGRSVRGPSGEPRTFSLAGKHYVPPRSHASVDCRDQPKSGRLGQGKVLVRSISTIPTMQGSTIASGLDNVFTSSLPRSDHVASSWSSAHKINNPSAPSTRKSYRNTANWRHAQCRSTSSNIHRPMVRTNQQWESTS